jgi:hypothetical protein
MTVFPVKYKDLETACVGRHKLVTFFTDKYKNSLSVMLSSMKDDFELDVVEIPQQEMDGCLSNDGIWKHRWAGCVLKLELLRAKIEENMGRHMLFTDCDCVFLKPVCPLLDEYRDNGYDIVLMHDCVFGTPGICVNSWTLKNIGFMFIKCSPAMLRLIEASIIEVKDLKWDQDVLTRAIHNSGGLRVGAFNNRSVMTDAVYNGARDAVVVKVISHSRPKWETQAAILERAAAML